MAAFFLWSVLLFLLCISTLILDSGAQNRGTSPRISLPGGAGSSAFSCGHKRYVTTIARCAAEKPGPVNSNRIPQASHLWKKKTTTQKTYNPPTAATEARALSEQEEQVVSKSKAERSESWNSLGPPPTTYLRGLTLITR